MGTAGPLALARDKLIDSKRSPFFVLNADGESESRYQIVSCVSGEPYVKSFF